MYIYIYNIYTDTDTDTYVVRGNATELSTSVGVEMFSRSLIALPFACLQELGSPERAPS